MLYFRIPFGVGKCLNIIENSICVAAIRAMHFSCVASAAHFLIFGGKENEEKKANPHSVDGVGIVCPAGV